MIQLGQLECFKKSEKSEKLSHQWKDKYLRIDQGLSERAG